MFEATLTFQLKSANQLHLHISAYNEAILKLCIGIKKESFTTVITEYASRDLNLLTLTNTALYQVIIKSFHKYSTLMALSSSI